MKKNSTDKILKLYVQQMEIVKMRVATINSILSEQTTTMFKATNIELCALQLRKVMELIILSTLVANSDEYKNYYNRLGREWNARLICKDLKRVNKNYYPKPIEIQKDNQAPDKFIDKKSGYLTEDKMLDYYEKFGRIMHSDNPFSSPVDYAKYEKMIVDCRNGIMELLNPHLCYLVGEQSFLYVGMQSPTNGKVHINLFGKVGEYTL